MYKSRSFNKVVSDGVYVVKSSYDVHKITSEYEFYGLLPESIKHFFIEPLDLKMGFNQASYKTKRVPNKDLGFLLAHNKLSNEELDLIFLDLSELLTSSPLVDMRESEGFYLILNKLNTRISDFYTYFRHRYSIPAELEPSLLLSRFTSLWDAVYPLKPSFYKRLSHGDLCFSNMFYTESGLKLIDPKGALTAEELYIDEYYDLAKLSHSIVGCYDHITHGTEKRVNSYAYDKLLKLITTLGANMRLVRLYEASLFLSMIPLHADNKQHVMEFLKECDLILKEVEG